MAFVTQLALGGLKNEIKIKYIFNNFFEDIILKIFNKWFKCCTHSYSKKILSFTNYFQIFFRGRTYNAIS